MDKAEVEAYVNILIEPNYFKKSDAPALWSMEVADEVALSLACFRFDWRADIQPCDNPWIFRRLSPPCTIVNYGHFDNDIVQLSGGTK